jgi:hypothetical protein
VTRCCGFITIRCVNTRYVPRVATPRYVIARLPPARTGGAAGLLGPARYAGPVRFHAKASAWTRLQGLGKELQSAAQRHSRSFLLIAAARPAVEAVLGVRIEVKLGAFMSGETGFDLFHCI